MRTDEEYAKDSIALYLKKHHNFAGDIIEGEDPPDYYVLINKKKIVLEITTAESIYNGENEKSKRKTSTESIARLCEELSNEFRKLIPAEKSLMLIFKVPILDFSRFKKQFKITLKKFLQSRKVSHKIFNINGNGEIVEARWIVRSDNSRKALVGVIGAKKPIINIQEQTRLILEKIMMTKNEKLKKLKNEKWLGILNNYPLAESSNFFCALKGVKIVHSFSRVFIIENNSDVFEMRAATS